MAAPHILDERTARDIDAVVSKLLRDLGNPGPPVQLDLIREVLALDRKYYSSSDTSLLEETIHRIRVGAKQAIQRPGLLLDIIRHRKLSALWVPDRRRILIDAELPTVKHRWTEAHEIGHSLIPWHAEMAHGDNELTLSLACEQQIEAEANFAASRLLFLQDSFRERLLSGDVTFGRVRALSREFGNTMTSTLWRTVETMPGSAFGMVSRHPRERYGSPPGEWIQHFIPSNLFLERFPSVSAEQIFRALGTFCRRGKGPIGQDEIVLIDALGQPHEFFVESFYNGHQALTLGLHRRVHIPIVVVPR
ncbi:MAG TPA: ImmA/IrrE family metallo-endopeptidase [Longimicrobium sp.]|nr:ImmA/IrrE family metallo-endopeptidase [Longimicrobium sp.]